MELELATTKELLDELTNRYCFTGIVIWSDKETINENQNHQDFEVFSSLTPEDTSYLLKGVADEIESHF